MPDSSTQNSTTDFITQRLANYQTTAEGSLLPPRQRGQFRVPFPGRFRVLQTTSGTASTVYTLAWDNVSSGANLVVDHYNLYYTYQQGDSKQQVGPVTANASPAQIAIPSSIQSAITFYIQTVLGNGMTSILEAAPTATSVSTVPSLSIPPGSITQTELANNSVGTPQLIPGAVTLATIASGLQPIQVVASLPAYNSTTYPQGTVVFNEADNKLYRA